MTTKILIGSVLKPVDDVRHYHKIAKSLSAKNVEIHIFGYPSGNKSEVKNIVFHSPKPFKRMSLGRIWVYYQYIFLGLKLKPNIIICGTHELLKESIFIKYLTGSKVIYDIRENYYSNIIHTNAFPSLIKFPVAFLTRLNEHIQSLFVSHFLLAEKCYANELSFVNKKNSTIIENKLQIEDLNTSDFKIQNSNFIITGTLGKHYGTLEGINFFKKLKAFKPEATLSISGICREKELYQKLQTSNFKLQTSLNKPIAHTEIIKTIEQGGVALLPYQSNISTENRIPTKFYEYLYFKTPMIIQKNKVWEAFLKPYKAAIFIDFSSFNIEEVIHQLENFYFYSGKEVGEEILWKSEEEKLLNIELIKKL